MPGTWIVTHAHKREITTIECENKRSADYLAETLPGRTEVTYQYTLGATTMTASNGLDPERAQLLEEAIQAHEAYLEGVQKLKEARRKAFTRAVYGRVSRKAISDRIGLSVRTINYLMSGK